MLRSMRDKWCQSLRSGEFKQGKNRLHNLQANTYCCLGVLCQINGRLKPLKDKDCSIADGNLHYLSENLLDEFGISDELSRKLAFLNDSGLTGMNFQQIADYIEDNVPVEGEVNNEKVYS